MSGLDYTWYDSDSRVLRTRLSMVWLRSSCLRGHTCLAHQLTLTLTQHTCAQGMILQVRTAAYRCETAMGIQMSVAWRSMQWIKHAILCQWRQSIRICCGLHGALDTLRKSRPCLWNNAVRLFLQVLSKSGRRCLSYHLTNHNWSDDAPALIGSRAACIIHG